MNDDTDAPFCGSPDTAIGLPCQQTVESVGDRCDAHQPTPPGAAIGQALEQLGEALVSPVVAFADAMDTLNEWTARRQRQRRIRRRYIEFDARELPPALPAGGCSKQGGK